ncbi:hypothetical protein GF336_04350 [Candidatus Woesearchaeota archaeon]|nr:hypothetical protein [Candidatus Woesearchaeota archaeon]
MIIPYLRKKARILDSKKLAEALYSVGLTPIRATLISLIFKLASLYFLFKNQLILAGTALIIDHFFDGLDGMIARKTDNVTGFGNIIDKSSDYILRRAGYIILAYNSFFSYSLALATLFTVIISPLFAYIIDKKNLRINKNLPVWGDAVLIFFVFFTGMPVFMYLIIVFNILFLILNITSVFYYRRKT